MTARVVITGIGTISAAGVGREALAAALHEGRPRLRPIRAFATRGARSRLGGICEEFEPREFIPPLRARRMDRSCQMAVAAARLAVADARIDLGAFDRSAVGIAIGTGAAGTESTFAFFRGLVESGPQGTNPMVFPNTVSNAPAGTIGIELGAAGPNTTFAQRGTAAEAAIICGVRWIRRGRARVVLAGGVDEVNEAFFHAHARFGVLSPGRAGTEEGMRPFDRGRNGYVLGEGATVLVLEERGAARERSARVLGEVAGWGQATEPSGILEWAPSSDPIVRSAGAALRMAGAGPADLLWWNSSANGSRGLDPIELGAVRLLFGEGRRAPPVSSVKPIFGESISSGAVRCAVSLVAIGEGRVPPTAGLEDPEGADGIDLVRGGPREAEGLSLVLQDGVGEAGGCISLAIRKEWGS